MRAFSSPFALLSSNAHIYTKSYQPKQTNVVRVGKSDITSLVQSRGFESVNNQVPNSIARAFSSASLGSKLDTSA